MDPTLSAPPALQTSSAPAQATEPAVLVLTEAAVTQIKEVISTQSLDGHFLSVRVVPAGCSGLGYDLNLVKESKEGDLVWTQDGVQICTDKLSAKYLAGTHMDWVKTDTAAGFKFENPNAKSSCGCGSSFSA
ncbi:MAG: iron-sulfur cluster assembly accessory protein [Myxococcaceae bacterium]|jgi:iron-sulfur cluster assembly protein|nr:iron-sulfur cluster assembly accessory protein [Myxococcaceae bacterium]